MMELPGRRKTGSRMILSAIKCSAQWTALRDFMLCIGCRALQAVVYMLQLFPVAPTPKPGTAAPPRGWSCWEGKWFDCWGFLQNTAGSLSYSIKRLEVIVGVIQINKPEVNFYAICVTQSAYFDLQACFVLLFLYALKKKNLPKFLT